MPHAELPQKTQFVGNNTKSLHLSVAASLKKLRTDYIDILYLHWWDYTTSVEEVMNGLHNLVVQGKVLYLGVSDTPAWVVSKANQYARMAGKTPFVIYQGAWSIMQRDLEREILPMVLSEGAQLSLGGRGHWLMFICIFRDGFSTLERPRRWEDSYGRRGETTA